MMHVSATPVALTAFLLLSACARGDDTTADSAAANPGAGSTAGGQASAAQNAGRAAPRDAEHDFLRRMVDHHEGLIQMATAAMTKASKPETQGDAHYMHTKQADEQKKMIADVQSQYGETVTPMVMPAHRAMADSLATKTGADYDRTFYRLVIQHHREALQMVDEMMPRFSKADVKAMAEKMRADQQKEIADMERKAGA